MSLFLSLTFCTAIAQADLKPTADPLPCSILDANAQVLDQKDELDVMSPQQELNSLEALTASGKRLIATVRYTPVMWPGERYHVVVTVDGARILNANQQALPINLAVYLDNTNYKIICVTR